VTVSYLRGGEKKDSAVVDADKKKHSLLVDEEPITAAIDGEYDLVRKLTADEMPSVIAQLIGDEAPVIVRQKRGSIIIKPSLLDLPKKRISRRIRRGRGGRARAWRMPFLKRQTSLFSVRQSRARPAVRSDCCSDRRIQPRDTEEPWNPEKVVGIFHAGSAEEADAAFPKIFHYGKYSSLAFVKGKMWTRRSPSERGIIMELREEPTVRRPFPAQEAFGRH